MIFIFARLKIPALLSVLLLCPAVSLAQTPIVPGSVDPSRLENRLLQPVPGVDGDIVPPKDTAIDKTIPEAANGFILKGVQLKGVSAFAQSYFNALVAEYVGRSVDLNTLNHLAARITQIYREEGYFLSRAVVPQQEVSNGIVTIQILEGHVNDVILDDPQNLLARDVLNIAQETATKIQRLSPLHGPSLERYILLLNDTQGISVSSVLSAPQKQGVAGAVDIILQFRKSPSSFNLGYNNYGSRFVGPHQASANYAYGGLGTMFETFNIQGTSTIPTNEVRFGALQYSLPLNEEGLKAEFSLSYSDSEPGFTLTPLDVEGDSTTFETKLSYPFIRTRGENLYMGAVFNLMNSATEFLDQELIDDKTRSLSLFTSYNTYDGWGGNNAVLFTISKGLDVFDATETGSAGLSRREGRSDYFTSKIDISRRQDFGQALQLFTSATAQYAPHPLLSSKEIGYGGTAYGRAYDPSEITGDQGVMAAVELRYNDLPSIEGLNAGLIPFAFYDIGKVWNHDQGGEPQSAASAGIGSYYYVGNSVSGSLQVAYPLTRDVGTPIMNGENGPRILWSIDASF